MYNAFAVSLIFNKNDSIYLVDLHKRLKLITQYHNKSRSLMMGEHQRGNSRCFLELLKSVRPTSPDWLILPRSFKKKSTVLRLNSG